MNTIKCILSIIAFSSVICSSIYSQACCTAGTPLLGSLEMTSAPKGILQLGFKVEHNSLTHVISGSQKLRNAERERISQSALLEINYGLTNNFSITALFSYIRQNRTITNYAESQSKLTASGLGDIALLVKYSPFPFSIFNRNEFSLGMGIKVPTGNSTLKSSGILIPADMQPGSGSWDGLFWGYYMAGGIPHQDFNILASISYRLNGSNNRFANSKGAYKFGNELIASAGFNFIINSFWDITIISKFRNTQSDSFSGNSIPNTGGNWIYFVPGVNFYLFNKMSAQIGGELPIFRNVTGTQLTTTFTVSLSLFYSFNIIERSL